jgi:hypothetical protein
MAVREQEPSVLAVARAAAINVPKVFAATFGCVSRTRSEP